MNNTALKSIKYIAIALVATMHYSCIKEVDNLNLPNTKPKLVVQSFISPGDSITATVYASKPINYNVGSNSYYSAYDTVKNATITLINLSTGSSTTIPFDADKKKYILPPLDFSIEKGTEYELNVTANTFEPITARTTVPTGEATAKLNKIDTVNVEEYGGVRIWISGTIDDPATEKNFYKISSYITDTDTLETRVVSFFWTFYSDSNQNGETINFNHPMYYHENGTTEIIQSYITILFYEIDEHYYKFHKSIETIYGTMDNPFTESSHLYSNIEGGLGVFASFVQVEEINTEK
ncbi:MAG: DUF4249 domain-containing protein [Bacteroidales bacterium]|jgi:hypothetical protein|nr:DUF4249 domain-containing protein [Bacteroidales bacterium]MDD4673003.1 DUF4249 domain-containing protein [Bacteroidales bacterium]MDY0348369.1 DUF4249 domain-containing protein [Tenuifilaceae bacterium]